MQKSISSSSSSSYNYQAPDISGEELKKQIRFTFGVRECDSCDLISRLVPNQKKSSERLRVFLFDHKISLAEMDEKKAAFELFCYDQSLYKEIRRLYAREASQTFSPLLALLFRYLPKEICGEDASLRVHALPEWEELRLPASLKNPSGTPVVKGRAELGNGVYFDCEEGIPKAAVVEQRARGFGLEGYLDASEYNETFREMGISEEDWARVTELTDDVLAHYKTSICASRTPGYGLYLLQDRFPKVYQWLGELRERCLSSDVTSGDILLWLWVDLYMGEASREVREQYGQEKLNIVDSGFNWKQVPVALTEARSHAASSSPALLSSSLSSVSSASSAPLSTVSVADPDEYCSSAKRPRLLPQKVPAAPSNKEQDEEKLHKPGASIPYPDSERKIDIQFLRKAFGEPPDIGKVADYLHTLKEKQASTMANIEEQLQIKANDIRELNRVIKTQRRQIKALRKARMEE